MVDEEIRAAALKVLDTGSEVPAPFDIHQDGDIRFGTDGQRIVAVMKDVTDVTVMRKRRAVKGVGGGSPRTVEWLYVDLPDGLRLYVSEGGCVLTREDILP